MTSSLYSFHPSPAGVAVPCSHVYKEVGTLVLVHIYKKLFYPLFPFESSFTCFPARLSRIPPSYILGVPVPPVLFANLCP